MLKRDFFVKVVLTLLLSSAIPLVSQSQNSGLRPISAKYALRNATIIQAPGRTIQNATILFENGVIKAIGTNVTIPADAQVIDLDSMYIYPGFISGLSNIGVKKPKEKERRDDRKLTGNPTYERAGVTPNINVRSMLDQNEKSVADFRKLGFTAAHSVPHKGMIPGSGAIILLGGNSGESMIVRENISMFSQWEGANGVYPNTVIGIMAKYRDLYRKSSQARNYSSKYASNSNGFETPNPDRMVEAMFPVVSKQVPVSFRAEELLDITRAITLKNDLGFNLILGEVKQGWDIIPEIKSSGAPVFLSFDLPELKEEKKDEPESESGSDEDEKTFLKLRVNHILSGEILLVGLGKSRSCLSNECFLSHKCILTCQNPSLIFLCLTINLNSIIKTPFSAFTQPGLTRPGHSRIFWPKIPKRTENVRRPFRGISLTR